MRFKPYGRSQFEPTERMRKAAVRRQTKEQKAFPLFADQIAEQQPSIDEVMKDRARIWDKTEQERRDFLAGVWRRSRARFFAVPEIQRRGLLQHWNEHRFFPGGALHFAGFMDLYDKGQLEIQMPVVRDFCFWPGKERNGVAITREVN